MHQLIIELEQQTPLLHFQWTQEGATLRASEVKPKLDKYIIENAFNNDFNSCCHLLKGYSQHTQRKLNERWNNGFRALDYQMKIEARDFDSSISLEVKPNSDEGNITYITSGYPSDNNQLVISNIGGKSQKEELFNFRFADTVIIYIYSKNEELVEVIKEKICEFFYMNNFGNRTSKGFGGFEVVKIGDNEIDRSDVNYDLCKVSFEIKPYSDDQELDSTSLKNELLLFVFDLIGTSWEKITKKYGTKGRDPNKKVLLGYHPPRNPQRIPSPIMYKPSFYILPSNDGTNKYFVNISVFVNKLVLDRLNPLSTTDAMTYYKNKMNIIENERDTIYDYLMEYNDSLSTFYIVEDSISIKKA